MFVLLKKFKKNEIKKKFNFVLSISITYMKKSIKMFELLNIIKKKRKNSTRKSNRLMTIIITTLLSN